MWHWTAIAVIAFLLVDGYVWKSSLLNAGIGLGYQLALAAGFS